MESLRSGQCQIGGVNKQKHFILLKYICHHLDLIGNSINSLFKNLVVFYLRLLFVCMFWVRTFVCMSV